MDMFRIENLDNHSRNYTNRLKENSLNPILHGGAESAHRVENRG